MLELVFNGRKLNYSALPLGRTEQRLEGFTEMVVYLHKFTLQPISLSFETFQVLIAVSWSLLLGT